MSVVVYNYGVPEHVTVDGEAIRQVLSEIDTQLYLAHQLRETFVTLEHVRGDAIQEAWASVPGIRALQERIAGMVETVAGLEVRTARERSQASRKGRTASSPALAQARRDLKELRAQLKALKAEHRDALDAQFAAVAEQHAANIKGCYRDFCQDGIQVRGRREILYWATYNAIKKHHKTALQAVNNARKNGRAAQLRHHRFDGGGVIFTQPQREKHDPPRLPATLADPAGKWTNVIYMPGWVPPEVWDTLPRAERRRRARQIVRFNIGDSRHVTLRVMMHRMLPPDADVTGTKLVARRLAGDRKWYLQVTATLPDPAPVSRVPVVALHLGWRRDAEHGTVRVATWHSTHPLPVPRELDARFTPGAPVVVDSACSGRIVLHDQWFGRLDKHDAIRAQRDLALDKVRPQLVGWLQDHGPVTVGDREITAANAVRWRSPARFARLAIAWRDEPPEAGAEIATALEAWRSQDRLQWQAEAHGRDKALGHRTDLYRRVAAWLAARVGKVVLDDTNLAEVARRPSPAEESEVPSALQQRAARQRTHAAPGTLRATVKTTAELAGVAVEQVSHKGTTLMHYGCGHTHQHDGRFAEAAIVHCDGCGRMYDQDSSAVLLLLAAAGAVPAPRTAA